MSELRFSSEQEALQYLSNKTGKRIKVGVYVGSPKKKLFINTSRRDATLELHASFNYPHIRLEDAKVEINKLQKKMKEDISKMKSIGINFLISNEYISFEDGLTISVTANVEIPGWKHRIPLPDEKEAHNEFIEKLKEAAKGMGYKLQSEI